MKRDVGVEKVQVLLSYYNGENYIEEQLNSILNQTGSFLLSVLIRDDGSIHKITESLSEKKDIYLFQEENIGVTNSFFKLLSYSDDRADYFAFSDQDDYWEPNKLEVAISKLRNVKGPALYFGKTQITDDKLSPISLDNFENGRFSFGRSIIKNNCIGCTMVFNKALRDILFSLNISLIENSRILHDNLIYSICLGIGGYVYFDNNPYILYRQHEKNVVGNRRSILKKIKANGIFNRDCIRSKYALSLYNLCFSYFEKDSQDLLVHIISYKTSISSKLFLLFSNFYDSRSILERINIFFVVLFNRF